MSDLTTRTRITRRLRVGRRGIAPVVMAASVFAALVAGCSSSETSSSTTSAPPPSQLPEGTQLVSECAKTTQTLQSVHMALDITNIPNLPMEKIDAGVTNQPEGQGAAQGDAKIRTKPEADFIEAKFLVVDKTLYALTDGSTYTKIGPAEKIYDPGVLLDKDKGLANVIAKVQNAKAEGREKIDGVDVVKVTGTINSSVIDPIVPRAAEGAEDLPITLWVKDVAPPTTSAAPLPSTAASPGTGPNLIRAVVKKDQGEIKLTLSDHGKPVNVLKPGS
ncbi:LppX_LprAFG lipoprotein [Nocardia sp. NPDC127579]|uniref:LppX_LprAFG lipoprotein n=1 Tax=Nocardia sp. NPDC127579 TaxID=3345402 RepID=UPI00363A77F0